MPSQLLDVILNAWPIPPVAKMTAAGPEHAKGPVFTVVPERSDHARSVLEQPGDRALLKVLHSLMDAVILERTDQLETRTVSHVCESRMGVAPEVALEDLPLLGPVEHRAPRFQLPYAIRRFLRVELGHAPTVDVLSAPHGVGEVHLPTIAFIHVGQGRRHAALGHDRMGLPQEALRYHGHGGSRHGHLDGRSQAGTPTADDEHVVGMTRVLPHQKILTSVRIPMEHRRT